MGQKGKKGKGGKAKPKKKTKAATKKGKKKGGDSENISFAVWQRCEHSRKWHSEYQYAVNKLGFTEKDAKQHAGNEARKVALKCKEMRASAELPAHVDG